MGTRQRVAGMDRIADAGLLAHASATLRIFSGEPNCAEQATKSGRGSSRLSPAMTLGQFHRQYFRPVVLMARGAAPRNVLQYDQSIGYWERFTGQPALHAIDDYVVSQFLSGLRSLGGRRGAEISPNTIRKHCFHVQTVLDRTGQRSRDVRDGQALLEEVPWIAKPPARKKAAEDSFTLHEVGAMLAHCHVPVAPAELSSDQRRQWWRSLILVAYNTGMRLGTLLAVEWSMLRFPWIELPAWAVKGHNCKRVYANAYARDAVESIRQITGQSRVIWPWRNWPASQGWLHEQRRRLLTAAGLPSDRWFGFHGFRKLMCSQAAAIDPLSASLQAGHEDMRTTVASYVHPQQVMAAMDRLPQPVMPAEVTSDRHDSRR